MFSCGAVVCKYLIHYSSEWWCPPILLFEADIVERERLGALSPSYISFSWPGADALFLLCGVVICFSIVLVRVLEQSGASSKAQGALTVAGPFPVVSNEALRAASREPRLRHRASIIQLLFY